MELRKSRRHRYFSINFIKGPCTKQASDLQFGSLLNMGSDYGSSDLATIAASHRAHGPLIMISHWLIMGIDYGSLRSLNPYNVFDMKLFLVVPLGVLRVVLKRTENFVVGHCLSLSTDTPGQLEISWCYGHPPCMYRAQVRVLEQPDQICFCRLLKT